MKKNISPLPSPFLLESLIVILVKHCSAICFFNSRGLQMNGRGSSAALCRAALCCAVLCCAVLCCAVLCCAVLCCAVLCCAVLCCAVLCCAVLCCAVLYCTVLYGIVSYCICIVLYFSPPSWQGLYRPTRIH